MIKYYYAGKSNNTIRKRLRFMGLGLLILGVSITFYILSPLILWQIYFANNFSSQNIASPIPKRDLVNPETIAGLIEQAKNSIGITDYTNANNWFPTYHPSDITKPKVSSYALSIPKINIKKAFVSTINTDLSKYLVNYPGTGIPADPGNAVIFGHSTLPQLFNSSDYKTIFANVFKLDIGDKIYVYLNDKTYSYKIYGIKIVNPSDTSIFSQDYDNSYLTLVTCTPPGTIWKRLIVKAKLEKNDYARF
jgi:sortase A